MDWGGGPRAGGARQPGWAEVVREVGRPSKTCTELAEAALMSLNRVCGCVVWFFGLFVCLFVLKVVTIFELAMDILGEMVFRLSLGFTLG